MRHIATLILMVAAFFPAAAQTIPATAASAAEQEIVELEKKWNNAIQSQDVAQMGQFLADSYFLAVGVQGSALASCPKGALAREFEGL